MNAISLPDGYTVCNTWANATGEGVIAPSSSTGTDGASGLLYLYESRLVPASPDESLTKEDIPCIVVGITHLDVQTYYRVDFADATDADHKTYADVLRNHKYLFSIERITDPGYDTPDEAFEGESMNIFAKLHQWADDTEHVDFNHENYFYSETKSITLYRNAQAARTISVQSDVPVADWEMSFADGTKATASPLANAYYSVAKTASTLTFTALKAYSAVIADGKLPEETFTLKAGRLEMEYKITQLDVSPNDWSNGGNLNNDFGNNIPAVGNSITGSLTFEFAPGNLIAIKNANGEYTYHFASEQWYISVSPDDPNTSRVNAYDVFSWNTLEPGKPQNRKESNWNDAYDPCRKIGSKGEWYTPTRYQMEKLMNINQCQGSWTLADGKTCKGQYYGTKTVPSEATRNTYLFLPVSCIHENTQQSWYWTSMGAVSLDSKYDPIDWAQFFESMPSKSNTTSELHNGGRTNIFPIRCVRNKPKSP
ncbi:MAG: hypothetical protein LUE99_15180 [Bacteroides sp.]|nr:hypothetical protein [Bacteroides sp.]